MSKELRNVTWRLIAPRCGQLFSNKTFPRHRNRLKRPGLPTKAIGLQYLRPGKLQSWFLCRIIFQIGGQRKVNRNLCCIVQEVGKTGYINDGNQINQRLIIKAFRKKRLL